MTPISADRLRARDVEPGPGASTAAREVLASHFEGKELNSPNDVCVRSDGSIYFSDPWYGRMPVYGVERPRQLGFQGVYRVPPGGASRSFSSIATCSISRTGCAFRPTSGSFTSTTRCAR